MDKRTFDEAIGEPPPSTVDVDAVILRQRRAAMVRWLGTPVAVAAAAVVAVTVGAALAVPGGLGGGSSGEISPGGGSAVTAAPTLSGQPSSTPTPSGQADPCAQPSDLRPIPGDPAENSARLGAALEAAVRAQLPDALLTASPVAVYDGRRAGPLEFVHIYQEGGNGVDGSCIAHQDYYLARASITDEAGTGNLLSAVGLADDPTAQPAPCNSPTVVNPEQEFCEQRTGPAGELISIMTLRLEGGPTMNRVDVTKPDGTSVTVLSENVAGDGKEGGPADREVPPLTHDQLVTIALTPALTLFP